VPALRLCYEMSFSFENTEAVLLGLGEAGVVPRLGKFLALEDERDFALPILRFFESREDYYPQLLSIGLANLARVSLECESLFKTLCHHASPAQLIPVFSFFLSQLLLLSSVYLRDSGAVTGTVIVTDSRLSCWQTFLTHVPNDNLRLELICPILLKIITNCADLKCLIDRRVISSLFSRVQTLHTRDQHVRRWLLDLIDHAVTVRAKEDGGHGGREEAVLLLDHLVELRILSLLTDSLDFLTPDPSNEEAVIHGLEMLFQFDKKYEEHFEETPMMRFLFAIVGRMRRGLVGRS
jgi:hypothetical protein